MVSDSVHLPKRERSSSVSAGNWTPVTKEYFKWICIQFLNLSTCSFQRKLAIRFLSLIFQCGTSGCKWCASTSWPAYCCNSLDSKWAGTSSQGLDAYLKLFQIFSEVRFCVWNEKALTVLQSHLQLHVALEMPFILLLQVTAFQSDLCMYVCEWRMMPNIS